VLRSSGQRGVSKHGFLLALLALLAPAALAQETAAPPDLRPGLYVGVAPCASSLCHASAVPRDAFDALQNEYFTWLESDPHSGAFETLANDDSRRIAANLGLAVPAFEAPACLACHTHVVPPALQARPVEIEDGIACEACHGPAGGWLAGHHTEEQSHADSVAAGMVDLDAPERRAAVCLGCHLGGGERRVDHALLAAGHPQLVFELDNYTADLPPHWPPAAAYGDPERARRLAAGRGAGAWAVGQAAAFRDALREVAADAEAGRWPELARMRCDDCHHGLAELRWARRDEPRRPLGLPRWSPAGWVVLRHLVDAAAPQEREALDPRVAEVAAAVSRLGPAPPGAAAAAAAAAAALDRVLPRLAAVRWDEPRLAAFLLRLAADPAATADRESAEQVMLALNTLTSELLALRPAPLPAGLVGELEAMDRLLDDPYAFDPQRFAARLASFEERARQLR
jgi:hypothetical protein